MVSRDYIGFCILKICMIVGTLCLRFWGLLDLQLELGDSITTFDLWIHSVLDLQYSQISTVGAASGHGLGMPRV